MNRRRILHLIAASAVLFAVLVTAEANERIRFKNGHSIVAVSTRVEGEILYIQLPDGGEVGFPRSLVAKTETGTYRHHAPVQTGFGGRGPSASETMAYRRNLVANGHQPTQLKGTARSSRDGKLNSVGFSFRGSGWGTDPATAVRPPQLNIRDPRHRQGGGPQVSGGAGAATPSPTGRASQAQAPRQITPRVAPRLPRGQSKTIDDTRH